MILLAANGARSHGLRRHREHGGADRAVAGVRDVTGGAVAGAGAPLRGQSLTVSVLAAVVAFGRDVPELYALAALSLLLKVIAVPLLVIGLLREANQEIAGSGALGVANEVLISIAVAAFGFFAVGVLGIRSPVLPTAALSLSVAVILVAFILMIVRRDVVSQAIGFFSLENGVSLASLVVAAGMPLILEVAFLFDLLVAVVVLGC